MSFTRGRVFGTWDAPCTDDDIPIPAPVGHRCMHCRQAILEGDNGRIQENGHVVHRECHVRAVMGGIGHHIDHDYWCVARQDPDAGLGFRASALMLWNWDQLYRRRAPTPAQRDFWKRSLLLISEGRN